MSSRLVFIIVMPPQGAQGSKITSSPESAVKSKKKKSEGIAAEIIDIMKPGSDENIELGGSVSVVELDKINSIGRWKDMPPPDTPGLIVPAYAPDEETKAAAGNMAIQICQHPLVKRSILKVED